MKKILFTASTFSHIVSFHLPYIRWFNENGYKVDVACGGTQAEIPFANEVIQLPFEKSMFSPRNFKAMKMLRKIIGRGNYELISTHTSLAAFFTRLAAAGIKNRPKVANMVHGYLFDDNTPRLKRNILLAAEKLTASQTDLLLTMNQYDFETAKRYHLGKQVVHIPGVGVDFGKFDGVPPQTRDPDAFTLIYAAEFSERKNQQFLIRAMRKLPENVQLILAGDGALLDSCKALAKKLGVGPRITFPGHVDNMPYWYAKADAAVSSSRSEGLPFNIMEAMYAGLPVVASEVKGHTDLIQDGETGFLYPFGDTEAYVRQIQALQNHPELRQNLGCSAKSAVQQYSLENVFPQIIEKYSENLINLSGRIHENSRQCAAL